VVGCGTLGSQHACIPSAGRNQAVLSPGWTMCAEAMRRAAGSRAKSVPPWPLQGEADEAAGRSYPLTAVSKAIEAQMGCSVESAALQVRALCCPPACCAARIPASGCRLLLQPGQLSLCPVAEATREPAD
jgi:hypothetical protein